MVRDGAGISLAGASGGPGSGRNSRWLAAQRVASPDLQHETRSHRNHRGPALSGRRRMRVAVYTDQAYWRHGGAIYAERAFAVFLGQLARSLDRLVVLGRLDPEPQRSHYRLADEIEFVAAALLRRRLATRSQAARRVRGLAARASGGRSTTSTPSGCSGPHPLALAFALLALVRAQARRARRAPGHAAATSATATPASAGSHLAGRPARGHVPAARAPLPDRGRRPGARAQLRRARRGCSRSPSRWCASDDIVDPRAARPLLRRRAADRSASAGSTPRRTRCCSPTCSRACTSRTRAGGWSSAARGRCEATLARRAGRARRGADRAELRGLRARSTAGSSTSTATGHALPARLLDRGAAAGAARGVRRRRCRWSRRRSAASPRPSATAALLIAPGDADAAVESLSRLAQDEPLRERLVDCRPKPCRAATRWTPSACAWPPSSPGAPPKQRPRPTSPHSSAHGVPVRLLAPAQAAHDAERDRDVAERELAGRPRQPAGAARRHDAG